MKGAPRVTITIETGDDAFHWEEFGMAGVRSELYFTLRRLARDLSNEDMGCPDERKIIDRNGNTCGKVTIEPT